VQMSIRIGQATGESHVARAAKIGRDRIIATARAMGLTTPLVDTVSLPIGAAEVNVIDMTAGYAVFANGGKRAKPTPAIEVRNSHGDVIYRHDREAAKQVIPASVALDMNRMLERVPVEGTGRRAALDGVMSAGKTGTTNGYKDAWFVGYTGNLVAGVWFGNDDSSETNNMTGGSLPAMTWKEIMGPAHQNLDLLPIPGVSPVDPRSQVAAKAGASAPAGLAPVNVSGQMPRRSFEVLTSMGDMFRTVSNGSLPRPDAAVEMRANRTGRALN
jgi:penicillin-binding protein 1A